jgi:D-alanyl-D-alanine carboxypeptidase
MNGSRSIATMLLLLVPAGAAGCASTAGGAAAPASMPPLTTSVPVTSSPDAIESPTSTSLPAGPSTTDPSTSSTSSSTSTSSTTTTIDVGPIDYNALSAAATSLVEGNVAVSVSVWRNGIVDFQFSSGTRVDGRPVDGDSPFVIASVSKLVTALSIARLVEQGRIGLFDPVPWTDMGVRHHPAWSTVTVRQLLAHTSGMPEARATWLDDPGPCSAPLEQAMAEPPTETLHSWRYSNGNYCALGLLVEHMTDVDLADAAYRLVFEPAGVSGPFLSTDGVLPSSVPYLKGLSRLSRLGGAGSWLASTDDVAAMLSAVTDADLVTLEWPGIIFDQYGWGHTGSLDGAEACAWVLQDGYTVITAFVSGTKPNTGGKVCDRVVPALAVDLGAFAGEPVRNPD